jgi:pyrophosphatase PpaX
LTIKGVLFDLDGTLVNSTDLILKTFKVTLNNFIHRNVSDEEIIRYFGLPLRECLAHFDASRADEMVHYYRVYNNEMHDKLVKPFPSVTHGLMALDKMGIKKAVVTSKTSEMAKRGLKILKIYSYISDIIGCAECTKHKPDPEPMLKGAEAIFLQPQECLCVGDSPYDLLSGRGAGCKTIAVKWSLFSHQEFSALIQPDYVIEELSEIADIIESINEKEQ